MAFKLLTFQGSEVLRLLDTLPRLASLFAFVNYSQKFLFSPFFDLLA
jgi:hypothetical protein